MNVTVYIYGVYKMDILNVDRSVIKFNSISPVNTSSGITRLDLHPRQCNVAHQHYWVSVLPNGNTNDLIFCLILLLVQM